MREAITKLLVLQDRDRKILALQEELARIGPERKNLHSKAASGQSALEAAKALVMQLESERKRLELEVEGKKQQIDRYASQQLLTKKNEEYRALTHEIDTCKENISKLEDSILELMEQADETQKEMVAATREAQEVKKLADEKLAELAKRENQLDQELASLEAARLELAGAVDDLIRVRYERLFKSKGNSVVVGIERGVCGGCHMTLQRQVVVTCQADQGVVACPNCGRILFFTPDMDTSLVE